jgi:hypothetical protein
LQMSETRTLIRLLRMYFPRNWEFGSALSKLRNFGGFDPPPPRYAIVIWSGYAQERLNNTLPTKRRSTHNYRYIL